MERTLWYNPRLDPQAAPRPAVAFKSNPNYEVSDIKDTHDRDLRLVSNPSEANCVSSWAMTFHKGLPSTRVALQMAGRGSHKPAIDIDHPLEIIDHYTVQFGVALAEDEANDLLLAFMDANLILPERAWFADDLDSTTFGPFTCLVTSVPSSTKDHYHLFIDQTIEWVKYAAVLEAMATAGIVEPGYYDASFARSQSFLRIKHDKPAAPPPGHCLSCGSVLEDGPNIPQICWRCDCAGVDEPF